MGKWRWDGMKRKRGNQWHPTSSPSNSLFVVQVVQWYSKMVLAASPNCIKYNGIPCNCAPRSVSTCDWNRPVRTRFFDYTIIVHKYFNTNFRVSQLDFEDRWHLKSHVITSQQCCQCKNKHVFAKRVNKNHRQKLATPPLASPPSWRHHGKLWK